MKETIIISGADGFVGRSLVRALIEAGWDVVAIDLSAPNNQQFYIENQNQLTFLKADFSNIRDLKLIRGKVEFPAYLIHLGSYILKSSGETDEYDVQRSIDTNISGSYNLINVLKSKLSGVCLASSLDVYGDPQFLPINESHPVDPGTFYAASKLAMELYVKNELKNIIPLTILRFSHIYGPGDPHPKVLQSFIKAVGLGKNPVIYGDGSDLRDYIYISDIVGAIINTIQSKPPGIFNIASGNSFSLRKLAELVIKISGKKLNPVYRDRRQPQKDFSFDISKAKADLSFRPRISIQRGISELMEKSADG
jgi:UDP-glucose 4-epimerase